MTTKIAIACQGGGSQTAFTAGVLKALCDSRLRDEFEVVGVSGTSGGALCATLIWYSFRRGDQPVQQPVRIPKAFAAELDKPYHIPWIEMSEEMQRSLDYEGKLDRSPANVESLIAHGEERGRAFLAERARRVATAGAGPAGEAAGPVRHR